MKVYNLLLIFTPFLFSSCLVFHSGNVSSGPYLSKDDHFTDIGLGTAKSVFVLGFGNLSTDDLLIKAKNNLYFNRPLAGNEYYANMSTAITNKYIFFVIHCTKVTVSADILQSRDTSKEMFSKNFRRLLGSEKYLEKSTLQKSKPQRLNGNILLPADSVYFAADEMNYRQYTVMSVDKESVLLKAVLPEDKNLLVSLKKTFFLKNFELGAYKHGTRAMAEFWTANGEYNAEVIVLGVSEDHVLVKRGTGFFVFTPAKLRKSQ